MSNQTGKGLPSGIVKFTITRDKVKDILSEKYNADIEKFSVEEAGISISLQVSNEEEKEESFAKESGEEEEVGKENQIL